MPPKRTIDYTINLVPRSIPLVKRVYRILRQQVLVVKEYINKILGKGYIRLSTLLYVVLVLIVKKLDGGIWIYVDYRALNTLTIKNRNASPLIKDTLAKLYVAKVYSKFDIIAAFNKI